MSLEQVYDVLIIGSGPVGLAIAVGLSQQNINNFLVIDQTHSFRLIGQTVDLLPNGLKALKAISNQAYENIKASSYTFSNSQSNSKKVWKKLNLSGKVIYLTPLDFDYWLEKYGEGRVSISWFQIQSNLRNLLPTETIKINHRCVNLQKENSLISVDCLSDLPIEANPFSHWENLNTNQTDLSNIEPTNYQEIKHQIKAKLVIAADGINSTVRKVLYQNTDLQKWATPQYSGFSAISCLSMENLPDQLIKPLEENYFRGDNIVTICPDFNSNNPQEKDKPRIIIIRQGENSFGYLLHTPIKLDILLNSSPAEIINLATQMLQEANYPPVFTELVSLSKPENVRKRPYYLHPANIPVENDYIWSCGRVVLAGDAAHGMPPFIAQGTNQGFEDAVMLVNLVSKIIKNNQLDDENIISNFFKEYEDNRRLFMKTIQAATMNNHRWTQADWDEYSQMLYSRDFICSS